MFKNVIVRKPSKTLCEGITSAPELGKPDYNLAIEQHKLYVDALKKCGVNIIEDVMMVGNHFYVGKSARTNKEGITQFISILEKYGLTGSEIALEEVLHLKTGINYIENNNMLVSGEFINKKEFERYNKIIIPQSESYAANCIYVNNTVIVPLGYPKVKESIENLGYNVICVDTSEFRKIDGGLSCLSLRF